MKKIDYWRTWDDRIIEFERLTWQHLSNIHYYMNLIYPNHYGQDVKHIVRTVLFDKHGGILPYHPDYRFDFEKIRLVALGYLRNNGDIVVDGHKVGWYEQPLIKTK